MAAGDDAEGDPENLQQAPTSTSALAHLDVDQLDLVSHHFAQKRWRQRGHLCGGIAHELVALLHDHKLDAAVLLAGGRRGARRRRTRLAQTFSHQPLPTRYVRTASARSCDSVRFAASSPLSSV